MMGWFEKYREDQGDIIIEIEGKSTRINDCLHCVHYNNGKFFEGCDACMDATQEGVMNMSWYPNEEALEEMRRYREKYGDDDE